MGEKLKQVASKKKHRPVHLGKPDDAHFLNFPV